MKLYSRSLWGFPLLFLALIGCGGGGGSKGNASAPPTSEPHPLLGAPMMVSQGVGDDLPSIAANGPDKAVAVWAQPDASGIEVFASSYTPAGGWGTPYQVNPVGLGPWCDDPHAVVDPTGNIDFLWDENPNYYDPSLPGNFDVYRRRFSIGSGWSATSQITDMSATGGGGGSLISGMASNSKGAAVVSFTSQFQSIPGGPISSQVCSMTRAEDGIWASPVVLNPDLDSQVTDWGHSAINEAGYAITLWGNGYGGGVINPGSLRCALFDQSQGWSSPMDVDSTMDDNPYATAIDETGNTIAVFPRLFSTDGGASYNYQLYAAYHPIGSNWGPPLAVGNPQGTYITPTVAFNKFGQACVVWADTNGNVFTDIYTPGTGCPPQ